MNKNLNRNFYKELSWKQPISLQPYFRKIMPNNFDFCRNSSAWKNPALVQQSIVADARFKRKRVAGLNLWGMYYSSQKKNNQALKNLLSTKNGEINAIRHIARAAEKKLDDSATYCLLIDSVGKAGDPQRAEHTLRQYYTMQLEQNKIDKGGLKRAYSSVINSYLLKNNLGDALRLFEEMKRDPRAYPNAVTYSILISYMALNMDVGKARELLEELISNPTVGPGNAACYSPLLNLYAKNRMLRDAQSLFERMKSLHVQLDAVVYTNMINVVSRCSFNNPQYMMRRVKELLGEMKGKGISPNARVLNALIDSACKARKVELARQLITELSSSAAGLWPDKFTFCSVIQACGKERKMELLNLVISDMEKAAVQPDVPLYTTMLLALLHCNLPNKVVRVGNEEKMEGTAMAGNADRQKGVLAAFLEYDGPKLWEIENNIRLDMKKRLGIHCDEFMLLSLLKFYSQQGDISAVKRLRNEISMFNPEKRPAAEKAKTGIIHQRDVFSEKGKRIARDLEFAKAESLKITRKFRKKIVKLIKKETNEN